MLAAFCPLVLSLQLSTQRPPYASAIHAVPVVSLERLPTIELAVGDAGTTVREAAWVGIDSSDRVYVVMPWPGAAMQVFDADGCPLRVLPRERWSDADLPHFPPYAESVDAESWPVPHTRRRWVATPQAIRLVAQSSGTVAEHTATSLGGDSLCLWSVAGDGSACVAVYARSRRQVVVLAADGSVRSRWDLPEHLTNRGMAHDGRRVALALQENIVVADETASVRFRFPVERAMWSWCSEGSDDWQVHLARDGKELWLRRGCTATTIERFRMP